MADTRGDLITMVVTGAANAAQGDSLEWLGARYKMTGWFGGAAEAWLANVPVTGNATNPTTGHACTSVSYVRAR